jgi:hypothetical protein
MHRTTILLPPDLRRKADREAKALGISLSELIRRRLSAGENQEPDAKPSFYERQPWQGMGASDSAANHDQHLYGP